MNISFNAGSSGGYSSINKNSAQYKAVERDHLSAIIANEASMSEKERLIYETFGGRDTIIKNYMKLYDSNGNFLNAYGVAGMCVDGKSPSEYNQIINVSEDWRQEMFDMVKRSSYKKMVLRMGIQPKEHHCIRRIKKALRLMTD